MGAALSSTIRSCGICYFPLPEASGSLKRDVVRQCSRIAESYEQVDVPSRYVTDWDGLQESISRGCQGCQAITELLLEAAADDDVVLDKNSRITFVWPIPLEEWPRDTTVYGYRSYEGGLPAVGRLRICITVQTASPLPPLVNAATHPSLSGPYGHRTEDEHDAETDHDRDTETENSSSTVWIFRFDISCKDRGQDTRHFHPYAYMSAMTFGDTGSDCSLQKVDDWIRKCISTHEECGAEQKAFPDRVLEITPTSDENIMRLRLVEDASIQAAYACLSHRWGPSTPSCRTLESNLDEHRENIDWNKILKTFQEAVLVTWRLGLKYIWIDCLCIIQDNVRDWEVQASKMCDIYRGAYVTLAASWPQDSSQGMFRKSSCSRTVKPREDESLYVMQRVPEHPQWKETAVMQTASHLPLLSRSWVYQERLLSPRLVYFTRYEIVFECSRPGQGPSYCECRNMPGGCFFGGSTDATHPGEETNERKKKHAEMLRKPLLAAPTCGGGSGSIDDRNLPDIRRYWQQVFTEYSAHLISSTSDRLPALAGIARQFGTAHPALGRYVAGMWELTLAHDLMWYTDVWAAVGLGRGLRAVHQPRPPHIPQPECGSLPTWSWIAAGGNSIRINSACSRVRPEDLRIVAFDFELSGPDKYGAIRDASLELEGFVAAGRLAIINMGRDWWKGGSLSKPAFQGARGDPHRIYSDYSFFEDSPDILQPGMEIFCMKTGFVWGGKQLALVLRRASGEGDGAFQRIGMIPDAPRVWIDALFEEITSKMRVRVI